MFCRNTKLLWKHDKGKLAAINFDSENRPRRQQMQNQFVENGMFYFSTRQLITKGVIQSNRLTFVLRPNTSI